MGLDRRISGANRRDLRRSDQGRRKPNRTRIYPPIRGPRLNATPVVADAALDADRRSGWRRASPGAVLFFEFFTLDAVVQRCQRSTTKGSTADNSQALQRISHDNLQNSNARRCTTFAVASVVVVQR